MVPTGRAGEFLHNDQRIGTQPEWIPITPPPGQPRSGPAAAGQGRMLRAARSVLGGWKWEKLLVLFRRQQDLHTLRILAIL